MSKLTTILLIAILIISAFFRLHNITQTPPGLYPDEAMNGNNLLEAIATVPPAGGFKVFYPENNGREGLFINIQALSVMAFGNQPWALRLPSAIFGILTVLGIYFLTKELFSKYPISDYQLPINDQIPNENFKNSKIKNFIRNCLPADRHGKLEIRNLQSNELIALFASFLLATSFWHVNFSRIGFRAIMAPFFLTWGVYFLLKSLNNLHLKSYNLRIISYSALSGLIYGLGFYSYIAYRATPLIIAVILLYYWLQETWEIRKKILLVVFLFSVFAILAFAPLGSYFISNPQDFFGRTSQISVFSSETPVNNLLINVAKTLGMFNFSGDWNWRHNYSGKPELSFIPGIFFLIGIFFTIYYLIKNLKNKIQSYNLKFKNNQQQKNNQSYGFPIYILTVWFLVAALPVVISNEGLPHALRAILMIPPVIILSAFGGVLTYEKIKNILASQNSRIFLRLTAYGLCLIIVIAAYQAYFIKWARNPNTAGAFARNYAEIGNQLNFLPKEMPKYVLVQAGGADVRGIPMPAQTVMFITDTFTPEKQKEKNIFYVLPQNADKIPQGAYTAVIK